MHCSADAFARGAPTCGAVPGEVAVRVVAQVEGGRRQPACHGGVALTARHRTLAALVQPQMQFQSQRACWHTHRAFFAALLPCNGRYAEQSARGCDAGFTALTVKG